MGDECKHSFSLWMNDFFIHLMYMDEKINYIYMFLINRSSIEIMDDFNIKFLWINFVP
jgi:hypothetical protein